MKRLCLSLLITVAVLQNASLAEATSFTLDMSQLPSAQGWTYVAIALPDAYGGSVPETNIYSVSSGVLHQNSLGIGFAGAGANGYWLYNLPGFDISLPFSIAVRARVLQDEEESPGFLNYNPFGFGIEGFAGPQNWFAMGLSSQTINIGALPGNIIAFDNTTFHDYRLEVTPGVGQNLYVDNVLVGTSALRTWTGCCPSSPNPPYVLGFGDLTGGANALADVASFTFSQGDSTPPLISPSVLGTQGNNGWYRSNVTVTWSVTDPESGIASSTGCAETTLSTDTTGVTLTCSATNGVGLSASASVTIKIDQTPPVISGMPVGCSLWPPNHNLVQVAVVGAADPVSGLAPRSFQVTGTSNEPDSDSTPQIVITPSSGGYVIQLEADRRGDGNGRLYKLSAMASDVAGNTATVTAFCSVQHDQGGGVTPDR
jgi:hypothetical protein